MKIMFYDITDIRLREASGYYCFEIHGQWYSEDKEAAEKMVRQLIVLVNDNEKTADYLLVTPIVIDTHYCEANDHFEYEYDPESLVNVEMFMNICNNSPYGVEIELDEINVISCRPLTQNEQRVLKVNNIVNDEMS